MEKIVIVGAGGFGREVFTLIDKQKFEVVGFIDSTSVKNVPIKILGDDSIIYKLRKNNIANSICIALGDMNKRENIYNIVKNTGLEIPPIIHKSAQIFTEEAIGEGTIIYPNVIVMADCLIGKCVLLNSGVTIGHDCIIENFSNINPGVNLAGRIKIGQRSLIGLGASIRENITIGDEVVIGAGSVVVKNISSKKIAYGVPANIMN